MRAYLRYMIVYEVELGQLWSIVVADTVDQL
jgi:hypothetical protein